MGVMEMQPGEVGSLSARIYNKVREGLIIGNFAPGDRLLMQDLAEQLGTSITPVREACLRLVSEQALELRSGRFVAVPDLSRARYIQIKLIRMALEGLATEHAADHVTPADLEQLESFRVSFVKSEKAGNLEESAILQSRFPLRRLPPVAYADADRTDRKHVGLDGANPQRLLPGNSAWLCRHG
ncbi:GntR family transcriptional regulator [Mesorhizobium sp. M1066]|uniref:GntR family transcriptional regulator n=1 Tax=Mesorhizobium opportunistum TaxID=593909 RepID=A0ABV1YRE1_9HYPH